jgi:hypothetical protein
MKLWILQTVGRTSLDGRLDSRKGAAYIGQYKYRTRVRASSGIRTHDPSVCAGKDISCFGPCGHCCKFLISFECRLAGMLKTRYSEVYLWQLKSLEFSRNYPPPLYRTLRGSKGRPVDHTLSQLNPDHAIFILKSIIILPSKLREDYPSIFLSLPAFVLKFRMHFLSIQCVLHV